MCSSLQELECVRKTSVETSSCMKPCSGLIVTSYFKFDVTNGMENLMPIIEDYNNFKTNTEFPSWDSGNF